jgi:hypothetical protein
VARLLVDELKVCGCCLSCWRPVNHGLTPGSFLPQLHTSHVLGVLIWAQNGVCGSCRDDNAE